VNERFDVERLGKAIHDGLAPYARPLFLRILPQMEITGTFKHRKVDLVRDGFDPGRISDPLYFRDPALGRYVPLDATLHEAIRSGQIRL
jgi:fatty-acyl-CoA synthase